VIGMGRANVPPSTKLFMKVLIATSIYPTKENPVRGTFVRTQVEYLKRAGVEVELLVLQGRSRKLMYPKAALELRRRLADRSIDLVHAHYSYVGIIARTQWKVPVVVSYCGDDILGTMNVRGTPTLFSGLAVFAGRLLSNQADGVIVKSPEMASRLKRKDVHVIPNEIDFEVFRPKDKGQARAILGLDPRKKYLLFAADPEIPVKRYPLAKAIADEMSLQDPAIELLVVYKEPQERLPLFMNACDALVFTSYQEGSPNVVKQAMACNLPIASTDVGDVREIIGNTRWCYICKPDVQGFSQCLADILRHRERTPGREQVQHLSGPAVAQRIIAVYEQVLRRRAAYATHRCRAAFSRSGSNSED
jgi:teichuronic acid biosynthesis glycosyltransferase TuaC